MKITVIKYRDKDYYITKQLFSEVNLDRFISGTLESAKRYKLHGVKQKLFAKYILSKYGESNECSKGTIDLILRGAEEI